MTIQRTTTPRVSAASSHISFPSLPATNRYPPISRRPIHFPLPSFLPPFFLLINLPLLAQAKVPQKELVFGKVFSDHMLEIDWDDEKVRGHGEAGRKNRGGGREEKREGGNEGGVWQERSEAAGMSSIEAEIAWIYKSLVFVCRSRPVYPPRPPSFPLSLPTCLPPSFRRAGTPRGYPPSIRSLSPPPPPSSITP